MNIGVDAFYLSNYNNDGIGNYLLRLMTAVSKIDRKNHYILYTPGIIQREKADELLLNPGFEIRCVPGIFSKRRRFWLQSPSLIRQCLKDDINVFFGGGEYFPLMLPKKIRVMITIHDVAFKIIPDAISITNKVFYYFLFPLFIRRSNIIFTVSDNSKKEIEHYLNVPGDKIIVIYNGIELDLFHPGKKRIKSDYILFVGTLQPRKNLINLIRGFVIIADSIVETLTIVGAPSWRNSEIRNLVESLPFRIRNRIDFRGFISGDELRVLYREAQMFALLSMHEGFGFPILEALASGTAVLTAKSAAIPEVFKDAVAYADPLSPEDIADKMISILRNISYRKGLEKKGLILSKKYDINNQGKKFYLHIERLKKIGFFQT